MDAFIVRKGGEVVGYLGAGPGPFISAASSALPDPQLEHVRYTSADAESEDLISFLVRDAADLAAAARELAQRGFQLEPAPHERLFMPPAQTPHTSRQGEPRE